MKILEEYTDEDHSLTMADIIKRLEEYGITAERKSVYHDIDRLREFGFDIEGEQRRKTFYYRLISRDFEELELKLLVDCVQSAKFITESKSNELIKKLESLVSVYGARKLQRQVFVKGRVKSINEKVYYNADCIHEAINTNHMISFQYLTWNVNKTQTLKHNGKKYIVSPLGLIWDNENYYLVAFEGAEDKIKHFRVDRMTSTVVIEAKRDAKDAIRSFDGVEYEKRLFNMMDGETTMVELECKNWMADILIDRFGTDCMMHPVDDERFKFNVNVNVSDQFFAWVIGLGEGIRIVGPERVVNRMKEITERLVKQYT